LSTASGDVVRKRRAGARRRLRPITWVILAILVVAAFGTMVLVLTGLWPLGGGVEQTPPGSVTPTSQFAAGLTKDTGLKVEKAGDPVRQGDQITVKVKVTNKVMQPPLPQGTPTPGAATPEPVPAKVYNATVKVLFYWWPDDQPRTDKNTKIVGSAVGNYFNPQGLANGESATIDVVAIGVGDFKDYQLFPDTVWTDKDPVKTPTP
jgi:hypothetical protein